MTTQEQTTEGNKKNAGAGKAGAVAGGIDKSRFTQKLAVNRAKIKSSDANKKDWAQEFSGKIHFVEQMPPVPNRNTGELEAWYAITLELTSSAIVVEDEKERKALPGEIVVHGMGGHTKRLLRDIAAWAREGKTYDVLFEPDGWLKVGEGKDANDMRVYKYTADPNSAQKRGTGSVFIGGPEFKMLLQKFGIALDTSLPVALHDKTIAQLTAGGAGAGAAADDDAED